ncbi:PREDICTED: uncharacterized protein LOC109228717 [Nicotiana attenuata]|uniref:Uncharacterized protein n=1 Tax=Nicotiana attenuata TaxID=49451 RepID=A0A1J6IMR6_NICAT|nr:PREDICTED: uncharacterized protein LOC109228717 [Nicotiana attenuata]OIT00155.1 hypothetical protein A4A49_30157 [Nicotiana attenuata]
MARTNKYTSLNFNDIYEKKTTSSSSATSGRPHSSSSSSFNGPNKTIISNSRIHGHMLVLSRPTPKPISIPQPQPQPLPIQQQPKLQSPPDQSRAESDSISLRPQGRTGSGPTTTLSSSPVNPPSPLQSPLPKSNRFVPPHLRPGFVGREEKPVPDGQGVRARPEVGPGPHRQGGHLGSSPNRYGENGRPKSGGGYERMRRGFGEADAVDFMNRPSSSGARPSSSG